MLFSKSRAIAGATVLALAGATLAGCTPATDAEVGGEITVTSIYPEWTTALEAAAEQYQAANPDATISIQDLPYEGYTAALQTQYVGGVGPDIALIEPPAITDFSTRGFLADLSSNLDEEVRGGPWKESFTGDSIGSLVAQDGNSYAVPWSRIHIKALYREDIFEEIGLDSYPVTWDEYVDANQALLDAGKQPLNVGFAGNDATFWWKLVPMLEAFYRPFTEELNLKSNEGWAYDFENPETVGGELLTTDEKYIAFVNGITDPATSPEYRRAIELILDLKPFIGDPSGFVPGDNAKFIDGVTPQTSGVGPQAPVYETLGAEAGLDFTVGVAEQPTVTEDNWDGLTAGGMNPVAAVRNGFVIAESSENRELAVDFLKFLTDPAVIIPMYEPEEGTPGEPSAVEGVTYPESKGISAENPVIFAQLPLYPFGGAPTYDQQDFDEFTSQFAELFAGTLSIDDFLEQRSASNLAALERNLEVFASEVDQNLIDENTN